MNKLANLELRVVRFAADDVIATSAYYIPTSVYSGDPGATGVTRFYADAVYYDYSAEGWFLAGIDPIYAYGDVTDEMNYYKGEGADYAYDMYDAYKYDGYYYTKGASYYEIYGNQ